MLDLLHTESVCKRSIDLHRFKGNLSSLFVTLCRKGSDVMKSVAVPIMELALDLSSRLNAEIVQVVGRVIVLYRFSKDHHKIKLKK